MAGLLDFWERSHASQFIWGQNDCALWVCNYIEAKTGFNPGCDVYGKYNSRFGYMRYVMGFGGLIGAASHIMKEYEPGCEVGVYNLNGTNICGVSPKRSDRVAFKTASGIVITNDAELIKGWNI